MSESRSFLLRNPKWCSMSLAVRYILCIVFFFFFQAEDGIRDVAVTGVQTCALPISSKTVAEWFPARERGVAVAIFDSGSSVGGFLAPYFAAFLAIHFGWRFAFLTSGLLGFLWLILWTNIYHPLDSHPRVSEEERRLIQAGRETASASPGKGATRWLPLLKQ